MLTALQAPPRAPPRPLLRGRGIWSPAGSASGWDFLPLEEEGGCCPATNHSVRPLLTPGMKLPSACSPPPAPPAGLHQLVESISALQGDRARLAEEIQGLRQELDEREKDKQQLAGSFHLQARLGLGSCREGPTSWGSLGVQLRAPGWSRELGGTGDSGGPTHTEGQSLVTPLWAAGRGPPTPQLPWHTGGEAGCCPAMGQGALNGADALSPSCRSRS